MTIYATVNGLTAERPGEASEHPAWTLISPAAILQGGNPYFVPDFASSFEARSAVAVRIGKLGKGIAPRFAHRYAEAIAPAAVFVAADLLHRLLESSLPWTRAVSYDRALALGKFSSIDLDSIKEGIECGISLTAADGSLQGRSRASVTEPEIWDIIADISKDNTLKTGDILLVGLAGKGPGTIPGQRASLTINGEESLGFNIR